MNAKRVCLLLLAVTVVFGSSLGSEKKSPLRVKLEVVRQNLLLTYKDYMTAGMDTSLSREARNDLNNLNYFMRHDLAIVDAMINYLFLFDMMQCPADRQFALRFLIGQARATLGALESAVVATGVYLQVTKGTPVFEAVNRHKQLLTETIDLLKPIAPEPK